MWAMGWGEPVNNIPAEQDILKIQLSDKHEPPVEKKNKPLS